MTYRLRDRLDASPRPTSLGPPAKAPLRLPTMSTAIGSIGWSLSLSRRSSNNCLQVQWSQGVLAGSLLTDNRLDISWFFTLMSWFQGAAANVALRRRLSDKDKERRLVRTFILIYNCTFYSNRVDANRCNSERKYFPLDQLSAAHPTWLMVLGKLKIKMCFSWRCGGAVASEKTKKTEGRREGKMVAMWVSTI